MTTARTDKDDPGRAIVGRRYFNVVQADRTLVLIRRIVADVLGLYHRLLDLHEALEAAESSRPRPRGSEPLKSEIVETANKLHSCLLELDDVGVELSDWEAGLVDFPCIAGGREVRLCWQYADDHVGHWHEIHACPDGRKPIATLPVADGLRASIP
ncbi:MAG: DUF2203 family protein [Planctomycetota bacterium]|jgi:hypothetical protein